jgi:hypothetical protein
MHEQLESDHAQAYLAGERQSPVCGGRDGKRERVIHFGVLTRLTASRLHWNSIQIKR